MSLQWSNCSGRVSTGLGPWWSFYLGSRGGSLVVLQDSIEFSMTANHQVRVPGLLLPHLPSAEGGWEGREHQGDPVEADGRPHQKVPGPEQSGEPPLFLLTLHSWYPLCRFSPRWTNILKRATAKLRTCQLSMCAASRLAGRYIYSNEDEIKQGLLTTICLSFCVLILWETILNLVMYLEFGW